MKKLQSVASGKHLKRVRRICAALACVSDEELVFYAQEARRQIATAKSKIIRGLL